MSNMYKRKVREALEINRLKTLNETDKTFKVLNRDNGGYVTTNSWKPLFWKIENHKTIKEDLAEAFRDVISLSMLISLNCNFDVRFYIRLKTAFCKLRRNITTC